MHVPRRKLLGGALGLVVSLALDPTGWRGTGGRLVSASTAPFAAVQAMIALRVHGADCGCFGQRTRIDALSVGRTAGLASALLVGWGVSSL